MLKLQSLIKYEQDDIAGCQSLLDMCMRDDPDVMVTQASLLFKDKKYDEVRG